MQKNFPNTFFSVTKDHNHDHPIAHLETMIATRHAIDTIPNGSRILDLFGNPRARDSFMNRRDLRGRTMETVVNLQTEKDYLRRNTKWGPLHDAAGAVRYHTMGIDDLVDVANAGWVAQFDTLLMIHTGYYVDMAKLATLLSRGERTVAKLIVHRHRSEQGKLFNGEVEYVNRHDFVVQRNVVTGERYIHPSLEWMFRSTSKVWRCATGALTWTYKRVTDETWIIDVSACPVDLDERFDAYVHQYEGDRSRAAARMNDESLLDVAMTVRPPSLPDSDVSTDGGVVLLKPSGLGRQLRLTNMPYYEYLYSSMVGKPRDKANLSDLFALARRENSLTSTFPGSRRFEVPPDEVADHVIAAFLSGVQRETELLGVLRAADKDVSVMTKLASSEHLDVSTNRGKIKTAIKGAKAFNEIRTARDTFSAILETVDRAT
nr:putative methyltransferase [Erysiphe necator associated abispo virus 2]